MAAGWKLKCGEITETSLDEERIWTLFNYVFSDSSKKRNTYKFGLIKSILDLVFEGKVTEQGVFYTYEEIFARFTENYWNLVTKYHLKQMKPDGRSVYSKIETILMSSIKNLENMNIIEFSNINDALKNSIIKDVTKECKKYVVGALYADFDGVIYSFDLSGKGIVLNECIYKFMIKYKIQLERLNYYSWAKFLEQINDDDALVKVLDKLELSTPRRQDLSIYREILYKEFEENRCFYCGKKLSNNKIHVDHFIPWSFVKNDKLWNFVLACPTCNLRKNNKLPNIDDVRKLQNRNSKLKKLDAELVKKDFEDYNEHLINDIWEYAKMSGFKE